MVSEKEKYMIDSVREMTLNFDNAAANLYKAEHVAETMETFVSTLQDIRDHLSADSWKQFILDCRHHTLFDLLQQDPLTSRAFLKPRGYAGDAEMLDLVYATEDGKTLLAFENSSALGKRIYHTTAHLAAARAVRSRRWIMIDQLNDLARRISEPHVLSLACGHLREARHCAALLQGRFGRFVAADQDQESLAVVQREVGTFGVETVATSVRTILKGQVTLGSFDFMYASGLYDYLSQTVAQRLTEHLFAMLNPGGRLLLANFLPTSSSSAFMEACMDWWLIYRTKAEMLQLTATLPESEIGQCHLFAEENENIVFLEVERKK
jgi:extracellular factor (EF) 3-hydroxypalmitic acid methyl ester biosynthesis protein